MSFGSPSQPPVPNAYAVAAAQQQANISVAIANTYMGNANVISPQGTSTFTQTGTYSLSDPQYDSNGNLTGTTTRDIPTFTQTISLSAVGQQIHDANQSMQLRLNQLGGSQISSLSTTLGTGFSLNGLPDRASSPAAPTLNQTLAVPRAFQQTVGTADTTTARDSVTNAILSRLEFQSTIVRDAKIIELTNSGIFAGSEAYANEMQVFDFQVTDGRLQAIMAGGQEQTRIFNIDLARGNFYNSVIESELRNEMVYVDFSNRVAMNRFQSLMAVADFINTFRERVLQETLTARNQPLNELSTMLHGGQIALPAYTGFKGGNISDTPLASSVYASANIAQQNYQAKVSQQNAMIGGIASVAGAALGAPMTGGGSLGGNLLSKMM